LRSPDFKELEKPTIAYHAKIPRVFGYIFSGFP
jgi:hypothetical protein